MKYLSPRLAISNEGHYFPNRNEVTTIHEITMTRQANDQSKLKILIYIIVKQLLITLRLKMLLSPSNLTSRSWRLSKVFILSLVATP